MIVGPGEASRHLQRALESARGWADVLLVYGDAVDLPTWEMCNQHATHFEWSEHSLHAQAEVLLRNRLLEMCDRHLQPGDLVAVLDADEEFRAPPDQVRATLHQAARSTYEAWCVHFLHLWAPDGSVHRIDGLWQPSVGPRIYRHWPGLRVGAIHGAWVCSPTPRLPYQPGAILDVLHWGYARPQDRPGKHERYSRLPGHHVGHVDSILTEPALEPVP